MVRSSLTCGTGPIGGPGDRPLAGCRPKISKSNFDQIKLGITQEEVQGILGPPRAATGLEIPVFSGTTSKWAQGDTIITVQFVNGKVVAKEFSQPPPK